MDLAGILSVNGEGAAAIQEARRADELFPEVGWHYGLGSVLRENGALDEAIKEYRRAIEIDPLCAQAHGALGQVLMYAGRLSEASESLHRSLELMPSTDSFYPYCAALAQQCVQFAALDKKLPAILEGKDKPADDAEHLLLARLCVLPYQKRYAGSCRFFADAFAHDAKLADDMQTQDRYNAACAAALAGRGQGADADPLDEAERARMRKQSLVWLRADLAFWTKEADSDKPADRQALRRTLNHWQWDADLSGVRDPAQLAKLPADEQEAWKKLWTDVQALLDKADAKK
jgi:tetratricopeptide (TPR) repeat protein